MLFFVSETLVANLSCVVLQAWGKARDFSQFVPVFRVAVLNKCATAAAFC